MEFPRVSETFDGKVLLLTGASGFVGKALLEKLLRECPGVRKIYVILRASRSGVPAQQRLRDIFRESLFDAVRASGDRHEKVVEAVAGDCLSPGLGLSPGDAARLQAEVQVFVHSAASVRFDDSLQQAVLLNARGAREAAALALGMAKLEVLVHVSTTYCNTHQPVIEERVYPLPPETRFHWSEVIRLAETLTAAELEARVAVGYQPNTYTFSKALAEQVMSDHADRLNIAILRPSIVIGAVAEPLPGWTNNLNGPFALCVGITKGLVRTTLADKKAVIDMVPLEMVVNGIILAARECIISPQRGVRVFNASAAHRRTLSVCESIECALKSNERAPHDRVLWHPFVVVASSVAWFTVLCCLLHFLPALLVDTALRLVGQRPRLVRMYWKIYKATVSLRYFSLTHWVFENKNFYGLRRTLRPEDEAAFRLDFASVDVVEYVHTHLQYLRRHILKENMDAKAAKRNQTMMYVLDRCTRFLLLYFVASFTFRVLASIVL